MDRHRDPWADPSDRLRRPLGIEVSGWDTWAPTTDGQERHVDPAGKVGHAGEEVGIAGEVDTGAPFEQVAQRWDAAPDRVATPVVGCVHRFDDDLAEGHPIAFCEFDNLSRPALAHDRAASAGRDQWTFGRQSAKRSMIEVIAVRVGDEDRGDRPEILDHGNRNAAAHVKDPGFEERVGQESGTRELDQCRGVPDVGEPVLAGRHYGVAPAASGTGVS